MTTVGAPLTGLLLAGGRARRLGGDKAGADLGGRTLLQHTGALASRCCDEVLLLPGRRELSLRGARSVADLPGVQGPLAGLGAGLAAASHPWCLLLSCDQPFVRPELVTLLRGRLLAGGSSPTAVVLHDENGWQPFCGLYHRDLLPLLHRRVAAGQLSLRGLLDDCAPQPVSVEELPDELTSASLFDVDTPADLARARGICRG